tara:strand:+ start:419 stop:925 length:507 start_codon:yes stop_codon:yes gene_type:complete
MIDIDPKEDELSRFAHWYLTSGEVDKFYTPLNKGLLFIEGVSGIVLYRSKPYQVELFICRPNLTIPEHTHPDVDSYECFLYGMNFTHSGQTVIDDEQAMQDNSGFPAYAYQTIRVRPNDIHGGKSSKNGGAFISIQHWLNDVDPSHVSSNWSGDSMGEQHSIQANLNG